MGGAAFGFEGQWGLITILHRTGVNRSSILEDARCLVCTRIPGKSCDFISLGQTYMLVLEGSPREGRGGCGSHWRCRYGGVLTGVSSLETAALTARPGPT